MMIARILMLVPMLAIVTSLHAQQCSGGPDGGADAAGPQCNAPGGAFELSSGVDVAPAVALRNQGLDDYERGHYDAAVRLFRRAAELGDIRSAEMIVLMHRHNAQLYGGRVAVSAVEAKKWTDVVARATQATVAAGAQAQR